VAAMIVDRGGEFKVEAPKRKLEDQNKTKAKDKKNCVVVNP